MYFSLLAPVSLVTGVVILALGQWLAGVIFVATGLMMVESLREDPESFVGRAWRALAGRRDNN